MDEPILEYLETQPPDRRAELMKVLEEKEDMAAEASHPNEGAERCLSVLKNKDIALGILTRNSLSSVKKALEKFKGITVDDFAVIITRDFSLPKPHPSGVYHAARQMSVLPSELLVVGDFRFDVMAGKAAGARTALLTNSGRSGMAPGDPEPDYTLQHLDALLEIV